MFLRQPPRTSGAKQLFNSLLCVLVRIFQKSAGYRGVCVHTHVHVCVCACMQGASFCAQMNSIISSNEKVTSFIMSYTDLYFY